MLAESDGAGAFESDPGAGKKTGKGSGKGARGGGGNARGRGNNGNISGSSSGGNGVGRTRSTGQRKPPGGGKMPTGAGGLGYQAANFEVSEEEVQKRLEQKRGGNMGGRSNSKGRSGAPGSSLHPPVAQRSANRSTASSAHSTHSSRMGNVGKSVVSGGMGKV